MNKLKPLLALFLSAAMASASAQEAKQSQAVENTINPYLVVGNYPANAKEVFMFFSFTCPYCNASWAGMEQWGRTLPSGYRFVPVPLITEDKSSWAAAMAYYTVLELAPARIDEFKRYAYSHGLGRPDTSGAGYLQILQRMGFTPAQLDAVAQNPRTGRRIDRALELSKRYNARMTPLFAVGGKYTTHPGYTGGDFKVLTDLLNALVSKTIEEDARR